MAERANGKSFLFLRTNFVMFGGQASSQNITVNRKVEGAQPKEKGHSPAWSRARSRMKVNVNASA